MLLGYIMNDITLKISYLLLSHAHSKDNAGCILIKQRRFHYGCHKDEQHPTQMVTMLPRCAPCHPDGHYATQMGTMPPGWALCQPEGNFTTRMSTMPPRWAQWNADAAASLVSIIDNPQKTVSGNRVGLLILSHYTSLTDKWIHIDNWFHLW